MRIADIIVKPLTETHLRTNYQFNNLFYSDMNNLTSILRCCSGPKCVSSSNDTKALFLCDSHASLIFITYHYNHPLTNKQLIDLLYNETNSLSSIFSWCNGVKIIVLRKDRLALSHGDNHFDTFVLTLPENHLQTN